MPSSFYRGAAAAVISYDITSQQSFEKADSWLQEIRQLASGEILIALVGCKSDLVASRQVDPNSALAYAIKSECLFMETSAKK
jgi:Ras-related protein Rab-5C